MNGVSRFCMMVVSAIALAATLTSCAKNEDLRTINQLDGVVRPYGQIRLRVYLEEGSQQLRHWQGSRDAFHPYSVRILNARTEEEIHHGYRLHGHGRRLRLSADRYNVLVDAGGIQRTLPVQLNDKDDLVVRVVLNGGLLDYRLDWHGKYEPQVPKRCQVFRVPSKGARKCIYESGQSSAQIAVPPGTYAFENFCGNERREVIQTVEIGKTYEIASPFAYDECRRLAQEAGMLEQ